MKRMISLLAVVLVAALFVTSVDAAIYTGTVTFTCTGFGDEVGYVTYDRLNSLSGIEGYRVDVTDGAGTLIYTFSFGHTVPSTIIFGSALYTTLPRYNPITMTFISLSGNGFSEQLVTQQQGSCDGLPTFGQGCPILPESVAMGTLPQDTQAFHYPGQQPADFVDPGLYWVIAIDPTSKYYQILVGCLPLWVPVASVQPTFKPPWQGQPLPS